MWEGENFGLIIGTLAAICTTMCNLPQVMKVYKTREIGDLSLKMLLLLNFGLALWVAYGFIRHDWLICVANLVGISLTAYLLWVKLAGSNN